MILFPLPFWDKLNNFSHHVLQRSHDLSNGGMSWIFSQRQIKCFKTLQTQVFGHFLHENVCGEIVGNFGGVFVSNEW